MKRKVRQVVKSLPDRVLPMKMAEARTLVRRRQRQLDVALERLQLLQEELAARWAVSWTARLDRPLAQAQGPEDGRAAARATDLALSAHRAFDVAGILPGTLTWRAAELRRRRADRMEDGAFNPPGAVASAEDAALQFLEDILNVEGVDLTRLPADVRQWYEPGGVAEITTLPRTPNERAVDRVLTLAQVDHARAVADALDRPRELP